MVGPSPRYMPRRPSCAIMFLTVADTRGENEMHVEPQVYTR